MSFVAGSVLLKRTPDGPDFHPFLAGDEGIKTSLYVPFSRHPALTFNLIPRPLVTPPAWSSDGPVVTIADASLALGISRDVVYELIGRGELAVVMAGSCCRIPAEAVDDLLRRQTGAGVDDGGLAR